MEKTNQDHWWIRKPQEQEGIYMFNGTFLVTQGVRQLLSEDEIFFIYMEIQALAKEHDGLDYLQVYERKGDGRKLFFIDQLNKEQVASGKYASEDHHCTLLLAEEY